MKKAIFCFLLLCSFTTAFSQYTRETILESPQNLPRFRFDVSPLNVYGISSEGAMLVPGMAANINYRKQQKFSIDFEFRKDYSDRAAEYNEVKDEEKLLGWTAQGGATIYFKRNSKESNWFPLKNKKLKINDYGDEIEPVKMKTLDLFGIRGGFAMNRYKLYLSHVRANQANNSTKIELGDAHPEQSQAMIFAGISKTSLRNMKVKYDMHGIRRKQTSREFYFDMLYTVSRNVGEVYEYINGVYVPLTLDEGSYDLTDMGFRLGYYGVPYGKKINLGFGGEAGLAPGSQKFGKAIYVNARFILSLSGQPL